MIGIRPRKVKRTRAPPVALHPIEVPPDVPDAGEGPWWFVVRGDYLLGVGESEEGARRIARGG